MAAMCGSKSMGSGRRSTVWCRRAPARRSTSSRERAQRSSWVRVPAGRLANVCQVHMRNGPLESVSVSLEVLTDGTDNGGGAICGPFGGLTDFDGPMCVHALFAPFSAL